MLHIDWDLFCQGYLSSKRVTARFHELCVTARLDIEAGTKESLPAGASEEGSVYELGQGFVCVCRCVYKCECKIVGKIHRIQGDYRLFSQWGQVFLITSVLL